MSRVDDCYDPVDTADFLRSCAFGHNISQSLKGKKGRKFLLELEAALLALPEKRLTVGSLADAHEHTVSGKLGYVPEATGDVCALGAVAVARAVASGKDRHSALQELAEKFDPAEQGWTLTKDAALHLKISHPLAYAIVERNDEARATTPEERYREVLEWTRRKLNGEPE